MFLYYIRPDFSVNMVLYKKTNLVNYLGICFHISTEIIYSRKQITYLKSAKIGDSNHVAFNSENRKMQKLNFFLFIFSPSFSSFLRSIDAEMKCSVISSVCRSKYQNRVKIGKVMTKSKISATVKWTDFNSLRGIDGYLTIECIVVKVIVN